MCQYFNEPSGRKAAFGVFVCCALQAPAAFAEGNSLTFSVDSSASALADDANYVQFYQGQSDAVTATKFVNTWAGGGFYNRSSAISDNKSDQHTTLSGQINTIVDTALGATVAASSATTTIDVVG